MTSRVPSLRDYLRAQLRPLVLLAWAIVSLAAPSAHIAMGTATVSEEARSVAGMIGRSMSDELQQRPILWRYDSAKLQRHLNAHLDAAHTIRAVVTDGAGWTIEAARGVEMSVRPVWGYAQVSTDAEAIEIWVAASTRDVVERSLLIMAISTVLATLLAGALYVVPVRAMAHAEAETDRLFAQLETSRRELADLAAGLEQQVRARSAELSDALAELSNKERRLRSLSRRATAAAEADRRALSRDLHDSAGQVLTAIRIHLQRLANPGMDELAQTIATQAMSLADQAVEEIRRVVTRLTPAVLDDMGLGGALTRLCEDWSERSGMRIACQLTGLDDELDGSLEATCYRIVQEALTNVARHAGAHEVVVNVTCSTTELHICVTDDGRGFDIDLGHQQDGRGLTGMAERVALLDGKFDMRSSLGHGTEIHVVLPRNPSDHDRETVLA